MFLNAMSGDKDALINKYKQLLIFANWKKLPVIVTYEHPLDKKGIMPESLENLLPSTHQTYLKYTFSCWKEKDICMALDKYKQIIVAGCETDVCVLQTVKDLLNNQKEVFVLEDCLFSSEKKVKPALRRMYNSGAIPTTYKMMFYEILESVKNFDLPSNLLFPEDIK